MIQSIELSHIYDVTEDFDKIMKRKGIINKYKSGYYISLDNMVFHIYRIQIGINAKKQIEENINIIEEERLNKHMIIQKLEEIKGLKLNLYYTNAQTCIDDILKSGIINIIDILRAVIEVDITKGFECFTIFEYKSTSLDALQRLINNGFGREKIKLDIK